MTMTEKELVAALRPFLEEDFRDQELGLIHDELWQEIQSVKTLAHVFFLMKRMGWDFEDAMSAVLNAAVPELGFLKYQGHWVLSRSFWD